jgi:hypothetical protein
MISDPITQTQMEAGKPNRAADPAVNLTGSAAYREQYQAYLSVRPFGVQQIALAVAVLKANMVLPNSRDLYDFTLSDEQWSDLRADKAFCAMYSIGQYVTIRGEIDLEPLRACLHVGGTA